MTTPLLRASEKLTAIAWAIASPGHCTTERTLELVHEARGHLLEWQRRLDRLEKELHSAPAEEKPPR